MDSKFKNKFCRINNSISIVNTERNKNEVEDMFSSELAPRDTGRDQSICSRGNLHHVHGSNSSKRDDENQKLVYFAIAREWRMVGPGTFRELKNKI